MKICMLCRKKIRFWQHAFRGVLFPNPVHIRCADRALNSCREIERLASIERKLMREGRYEELRRLYRAYGVLR